MDHSLGVATNQLLFRVLLPHTAAFLFLLFVVVLIALRSTQDEYELRVPITVLVLSALTAFSFRPHLFFRL